MPPKKDELGSGLKVYEDRLVTLESQERVVVRPEPIRVDSHGKGYLLKSSYSFTYGDSDTKVDYVGTVVEGSNNGDENMLVIQSENEDSTELVFRVISAKDLREKGGSFWQYERLSEAELERQYNEVVAIYDTSRLTSNYLDEGKPFVIGETWDDIYYMPNFDTVREYIMGHAEIFRPKTVQGFTELTLVPFGANLADTFQAYREALLAHAANGTLRAANNISPGGSNLLTTKVFERRRSHDILDSQVWENQVDLSEMLYLDGDYPQGMYRTKRSILDTNPESAWQIVLMENLTESEGSEVTEYVNGRRRAVPAKTVNDLARQFQDGFVHENPVTLDAYLIHALLMLERYGTVPDCLESKGGRATCCFGCQSPDGDVPVAFWNTKEGHFSINPTKQSEDVSLYTLALGLRTMVTAPVER